MWQSLFIIIHVYSSKLSLIWRGHGLNSNTFVTVYSVISLFPFIDCLVRYCMRIKSPFPNRKSPSFTFSRKSLSAIVAQNVLFPSVNRHFCPSANVGEVILTVSVDSLASGISSTMSFTGGALK